MRSVALCLSLTLLLTACGYKGALFMADPAKPPVDAPKKAEVPAK